MKATFANKPKRHSVIRTRLKVFKQQEEADIRVIYNKILFVHNEALKMGIYLGESFRIRRGSINSSKEAEELYERLNRIFEVKKKQAELEMSLIHVANCHKYGGTVRESKMRSSFSFWAVSRRFFRRYWKQLLFPWPKLK